MQKLTLALIGFLLSFNAKSQNNDLVSSWILNHPDVILIESENFKNFSQEELTKLNSNYIVYSQELKESDLLTYSKEHNLEFKTDYKVTNGDEVKNWLAHHPELKIVTKSEYDRESEEVRAEYLDHKCLILMGEVVTIEDIHNYKF